MLASNNLLSFDKLPLVLCLSAPYIRQIPSKFEFTLPTRTNLINSISSGCKLPHIRNELAKTTSLSAIKMDGKKTMN